MKKLVPVIIIILLLICLLKPSKEEDIRVRIIPNSNSETDLIIKEKVKGEVIDFLTLNYDEDRERFIKNINFNITTITSDLESKDINAKISLQKHNFYNKTYNGSSVKNEEVLTFLVVIDEGKGDNWWGSIYPNFLEMNSSEVVEYRSLLKEIYSKIKGEK